MISTHGKRSQPIPIGADAVDAVRFRLLAYLICLMAAFTICTLMHTMWEGFFAAGLAVVLLVLLVAAVVHAPLRHAARFVPWAVACVVLMATLFPLGLSAVVDGVPASIAGQTVWPQALVAIFAARALAEHAELQFITCWRDPTRGGERVTPYSIVSALTLGVGLMIVFYKAVGGVTLAPERLDPAAIVLRAVVGDSVIHVAIVLVLFVVFAALLDATLSILNDHAVLAAFRRALAEGNGASTNSNGDGAFRGGLDRLASYSHTRAFHWLADADTEAAVHGSSASVESFHAPTRRMVRTLVSLLPLLGFLGTVIGLTAAIGGLPEELDLEASGSFDISASLLGLALQFETTLLGLAGALLGSLLLALLEREEAEFAAQCRHLASHRHARR